MKIILVLIATISILSFSLKKEIPVQIIIKNPNNIEFKGGKLLIPRLQKEITINKVENYEIQLQQGKYKFKFISETPHYITYPEKISAKNNIVNISLVEKKSMEISDIKFADEKNFETLLKAKNLQFIQFGIATQNHKNFTEKYGIKILYEGCVITPFLSEKATLNNKLIAEYLTKKYGENWKKDLGFLPFGLE